MRRITSIIALLVLVFSSVTPALASAVEDQADRKKEIQELRALVRQLEERLQKLEGEESESATPSAEKKVVSVDEAQSQDIEKIKKKQSRNNQRLMKVERDTSLDRVRFSGDYRFEAHSISGSMPPISTGSPGVTT